MNGTGHLPTGSVPAALSKHRHQYGHYVALDGSTVANYLHSLQPECN